MRLALLSLSLVLASPISAELISVDPSRVLLARFPGTTPAAVVATAFLVDPVTGVASQTGTEPATDTADGSGTWSVTLGDLDDTSALPEAGDCTERTLIVQWSPDAADCEATADCAVERFELGGPLCAAAARSDMQSGSFVFATSTEAGQGIDQDVLDFYSLRGQLPIRWRALRSGGPAELAGQTSEVTSWEVYFYASSPAPPHLSCVVTTRVDPTSQLPSQASCAGN